MRACHSTLKFSPGWCEISVKYGVYVCIGVCGRWYGVGGGRELQCSEGPKIETSSLKKEGGVVRCVNMQKVFGCDHQYQTMKEIKFKNLLRFYFFKFHSTSIFLAQGKIVKSIFISSICNQFW